MTRRRLLQSAALLATPRQQSWITLDLLHGSTSTHWPHPESPTIFGSLLKPFLVLAFSATHARFPIVHCSGTKDRCWLPNGHGTQDILGGLANSCNAYFLALANALERAALDSVCLRHGLVPPDRAATAGTLIGLQAIGPQPGWPQTPTAVIHAFSRLLQTPRSPGVEVVLAGMERCAAGGTARAVSLPCFAKTGTAPCSHTPRAAGDGFIVAIYPHLQPRLIVLLEQHGVTGAEASKHVRGVLQAIN